MFSKHSTASVDIDAQKGFSPLCPDELPVAGAEQPALVEQLNANARFARLRISTRDGHPPGALWEADSRHPALSGDGLETVADVDVRWPAHCVLGTPGFELLPGLPHPVRGYDLTVIKGMEKDMHPYGACFHDLAEQITTGLIEFLRYHRISTVIVGGLALEHCVRLTALQLQRAGFQLVLNLAATRGLDARACEAAGRELQQAGVVLISNAGQLPALFAGNSQNADSDC